MYDDPFADSSQIPTYLVSELARRHVTVALSGDGGDEVFAGYNRYVLGSRMWPRLSRIPVPLRRGAARAIRTLGPGAWGRILGATDVVLPKRLRVAQAGDRAHKLAGVMGARDENEFYLSMASHWQTSAAVVLGERGGTGTVENLLRDATTTTFVERMMYADARTYLSDDILVKVDRAAMSVSLETRAPFLDHRLVELAWRVPLSMKLRDGVGKWALRQILYRHVPASLIERPKMGFGVPIDSWLRGPLRGWASDLLDEDLLRRQGFFDPAPISRKWREHLAGSGNWQNQLWDILMFQQWLTEAQRIQRNVQ
jgi:asparagine synthase (glutamine-hydrolysing)